MFSFEIGPDIEAVSNASEFLRNTLNIWDNGSVLLYYIWRRTIAIEKKIKTRFKYTVN
jgi:hypothetical protein